LIKLILGRYQRIYPLISSQVFF